jgi:hypothetical protein
MVYSVLDKARMDMRFFPWPRGKIHRDFRVPTDLSDSMVKGSHSHRFSHRDGDHGSAYSRLPLISNVDQWQNRCHGGVLDQSTVRKPNSCVKAI